MSSAFRPYPETPGPGVKKMTEVRLVSRLCFCLREEMSAVKKYFATHDLSLSARISVKRNIALDRPPNRTYIVCDKRGFEC